MEMMSFEQQDGVSDVVIDEKKLKGRLKKLAKKISKASSVESDGAKSNIGINSYIALQDCIRMGLEVAFSLVADNIFCSFKR